MAALAARQHDSQPDDRAAAAAAANRRQRAGPAPGLVRPHPGFARELTPSVKQLGPTIAAGLPWLAQSTALFSPQELGGLLPPLTPAVQDTAASAQLHQGAAATPPVRWPGASTHNVIPTGNERIQDPPLTTGLQVYQELFQSAVGLAGIAQNFDGNGRYIRSSTGGGSDRVADRPSIPGSGPLFGNAVLPPLGTRPAYPGQGAAAAQRRPVLQERRRRTSTRSPPGRDREARDRHPPDATSSRSSRCSWRRSAVSRLHPRAPAGVRVRPELLHGQRASSPPRPR